MPSNKSEPALRMDTTLAHAGRHSAENHGFVNPPVIHASTVLFPDTATMLSGKQRYVYGRRGTPTTEALEEAITELEGAAGARLATSGLNAISLALLSCLSAGDHVLIVDSAYGPTRHFCETVLKRMNIEVEYYDPALRAGIAGLFKANTKAILTEAPGSLSFEMQDIPQIADIAHARGALVLMDNTWATPLYFPAISHGVDLSIQAATKYIVGHSDVMIGTVAASERAIEGLKTTHGAMGVHVGPDDVYLALRGLRTMGVRLRQHMESGLTIARWLETHPLVERVRHPALESDPGHAIWKRDFKGACGLFAFDFRKGVTIEQSHAFIDALKLFGLGYSWGGFESLVIPVRLAGMRTASALPEGGPSVRLHIGLEDVEDLRRDIEQAFDVISR
ncbi:cystathionine beta-lyase [Stappia sp. F7233]|uniref:Cystathionine beta-lyase n=1 Tax=Stappia albiluteola TaxID=2758565 RepID=A0A839ABL4_9HYPH|nr:cystathionine beta-lyase [Stappia albiluteola]MBA5776428.1 cystathionine beta-lyase [Stappia albiluteola]